MSRSDNTPNDPATNPLNHDPVGSHRVEDAGATLTTNLGVPVADNQNSLKGGLRGPTLLEDFILREKIMHFDHERIPERVVHARGSAAHGYFQPYASLAAVTKASLFQDPAKKTEVFVRFSTVAGERGSPDTARDVRGFAVKFYTDEGNWDLVGNNIPVFFIQDAIKFPDLVHSVKPEQHWAIPQASSAHDTFWDFVSLTPESTHMLMWVMSDRAIPRSYRMMQGFGVHTFRFVNAKGESRFVKFHWKPVAGTHSLAWDEAVKINGADPDFHRRDLWEAIESGEFPEYELGVQLFTEEQAEGWSFDVLDATKIVPEELVPVTPVGRMVLNRNPDNFFAETEQVAFCAGNVVPGIDFSNDPLLAGRLFSYLDTQLTRLGGPNFHEIPINRARCPVHNNQRDGFHRTAIVKGRVAYEPNSLRGNSPAQAPDRGFASFPEALSGAKVRGKPDRFAEHFNQARLFWKSQSPVEQNHIVNAYRFELGRVESVVIRERVVAQLAYVDGALASRVAEGLGLTAPAPPALHPSAQPSKPEVESSPPLSLLARPGEVGIRTRKVALLVADGFDGAATEELRDALLAAGAVPFVVATRVGPVKAATGNSLVADASLATMPSVLFDGAIVPGGDAAVDALRADGRAVEFVRDLYRHCKTLGALGGGARLLDEARIPSAAGADPGLVVVADASRVQDAFAEFATALAKHRHWDRETDPPRV